MTEHPTTPADDERDEDAPRDNTQPIGTPVPAAAPHVDPSTLRSAYAFDGSGPYLYAPDGSGPYTYTHDGHGPYLVGATAGATDATAGAKPKRRRVGLMVGAGVATLAIVSAAGGTAFGLASRDTGTTTSSQSSGSSSNGSSDSGGIGGGWSVPGDGSSSGSSGSGTSGTGSSGSTDSARTAATDSQKAGIVTIDTTLDYDSSSQAAGTGMIISSDGEILTNNHVVEDATSIEVTVESTGKTYTADVVGTDKTDDVAVLELRGASDLTTATLDDDDDLAVGDTVTDVGNAEGQGELVAAKGSVTALDQDITVQSESGTGTESLTGLIEVAADVVSGDSGGPLLDSEGEVVGMTTAASSGTSDVTGYAIPIATAKSIAERILSGTATSTIVIGTPAFLGAEVSSTTPTTGSGVTLQGVVSGSPAENAGLAAGDTITSIDGTAVTGADQLTELIQAHAVGDSVTVGYTAADGTAGTVTATLVAGPAA
ncbi:S1C family serine protease [Curtobacterium sp. MCBD17_013]|uniref:S1C family serine protease n=1 Tax=Curtobacterium sp. MCBD17_013 TaxID=2175668 RepID=UPI0021ABC37E|nr:S1C family serine protease [Curtobacterium sp. MCBD17_013]